MSQSATVELNNYLQSKGLTTALSWIERTDGPEHAPIWICECKISGKSYATGSGSSKQAARKAAAQGALEKIKEDGGV